MPEKQHGIVASGHPATSRAAADIIEQGGNAFDAALAALCAACVSEPLLSSLAGGGFLLAHQQDGRQCLYDFFCQTPAVRLEQDDIDFFPFTADFGADEQEFHIGMGSMAVPGVVAGLFAVHQDLCRLALTEIIRPACELARQGVLVNERQAYIARVLGPMLLAGTEASDLHASGIKPGEFVTAGEYQSNPLLADALEAIAREGHDLFYRGEWAEHIAADCAARGGQLTTADLAGYKVQRRAPVRFRYRDADCAINPLPSPGGCLVAFSLGLLPEWLDSAVTRWGEPEHLLAVLRSMHSANRARRLLARGGEDYAAVQATLLDESTIDKWRHAEHHNPLFSRGTTHISVADASGNLASLTVSNGEGCGYIIPGTGIMMNNMLGEEDLNPAGFHRWKPGARLASMMSPAVVLRDDGSRLSLGTGGSNRIRNAMLQVLINLLDFNDPLDRAVTRPRIHLQNRKLSVEGGFAPATVAALEKAATCIEAATHVWPEANLYFGGVNAAQLSASGLFSGASDPRREGSVVIARS